MDLNCGQFLASDCLKMSVLMGAATHQLIYGGRILHLKLQLVASDGTIFIRVAGGHIRIVFLAGFEVQREADD